MKINACLKRVKEEKCPFYGDLQLKKKLYGYLLDAARTHWVVVHGGCIAFPLVFEDVELSYTKFAVVSLLRIFSIAKSATNAMQDKASRMIKNTSSDVLQPSCLWDRLPRIIRTSALFAFPSRFISSCFAKRYRESDIVSF